MTVGTEEAAEQLGGEGIGQCKGGDHSVVLMSGIADDLCITLSERGHDQIRDHSVVTLPPP